MLAPSSWPTGDFHLVSPGDIEPQTLRRDSIRDQVARSPSQLSSTGLTRMMLSSGSLRFTCSWLNGPRQVLANDELGSGLGTSVIALHALCSVLRAAGVLFQLVVIVSG
jgi:hypothetical protein